MTNKMKKLLSILTLSVLAVACTQKPAQQAVSDAWVSDGTVY